MEEPKVLLMTVHGSHLYGLNHANSDMDYYRVIDSPAVVNEHGHVKKKSAFQSIEVDIDDSMFNLKTFSIYAYNGVPQALEAMFSPYATVDVLAAYRRNFRASIQSMSSKYIHAIEKFSKFEMKRRRHALRYALNLQEAIDTNGRFNPVLSASQRDMITEMAHSKDYIQHLRKLSYFELNLKEDSIYESLRNDNIL